MFSEMFFVHLSKNEDGVYSTTARHEIILHSIDIKWSSYDAFDETFSDLHDVVQQF